MDTKYKINQIVFIVRQGQIAKCQIDEVIYHQTQKEPIIKYVCRLYGTNQMVTVDTKDLVESYDDAIYILSEAIEKQYQRNKQVLNELNENDWDVKEVEYQDKISNQENNKGE